MSCRGVESDGPSTMPVSALRSEERTTPVQDYHVGSGEDYGGGRGAEVKLRLLLGPLAIFSHGIWHIKPPGEYSDNDCPAGHDDPAPEPCHFHLPTPYNF